MIYYYNMYFMFCLHCFHCLVICFFSTKWPRSVRADDTKEAQGDKIHLRRFSLVVWSQAPLPCCSAFDHGAGLREVRHASRIFFPDVTIWSVQTDTVWWRTWAYPPVFKSKRFNNAKCDETVRCLLWKLSRLSTLENTRCLSHLMLLHVSLPCL